MTFADAGPIERLNPQDLLLIWPEENGWKQDIGALAILDGAPLLDEDGSFRIDVARAAIASRVHLVPRFRQVLHRPGFGLGWPLWVDAQRFDINDHVFVRPIEDEDRLLDVCEEIRFRPFDPTKPLWEMWFLPGLEDRQIGWFIKVHHAMADGIAGVALLGAFIDLPTPPDEPPVWHPNPPPTRGELFRDNVNRHAASLMRMIVALLHPGRMLAQIRRYWPNLHELFFEGRAPRTSFNTRIGSRRRFGLIRGSLSAARDVAHANDGKVNDVVLAAVAEGYRALLLARGERVDGVQLNAFVPVSLHRNGDVQGNVDGGMLVPLPIGEPDPSARLRWIAVESRARKKKARPQAGAIFRSVLVQRLFLATMPRQRFMNTYVANVPGPPMFLSFVGCRITELDPIVPITANVPIGVGALSYADQLNLTVVADPDIVPDLDVFLEGVQRGLDALAAREPARA